jgi:hypothetical protein
LLEGKASIIKHAPFHLRNGSRREERVFTFVLLPVIDEHGKTIGTYEKLFEVTAEFLQERQSETIKKIEEYTVGEEDPTAFFQSLIEAVSDNGSLIFPSNMAHF